MANADGTWELHDALGSVRLTVDADGSVLHSTSYDPWGQIETGSAAPFGFTGELQHDDLVYLRARWYATGQGRFVSRDQFVGMLEMPYSLHPYQYAYSDPVLHTDLRGRCIPKWAAHFQFARDIAKGLWQDIDTSGTDLGNGVACNDPNQFGRGLSCVALFLGNVIAGKLAAKGLRRLLARTGSLTGEGLMGETPVESPSELPRSGDVGCIRKTIVPIQTVHIYEAGNAIRVAIPDHTDSLATRAILTPNKQQRWSSFANNGVHLCHSLELSSRTNLTMMSECGVVDIRSSRQRCLSICFLTH